MKEKMLILLVAGLATAWLAGSGYALENDWKTVALWHMDELVIDDDPNYVADDDVLFGIDRNRDHDLEVLGPNNLVTPGYDAAGGCLLIDPAAAALPPDPNFAWDYSGRGTFKFQGQISSRDRLDCYIFATGNKQIVVWQRDADTDGKGEIEFSVKTAGDASTHTIYAEMVDSNAWQSVECRYELDGSNNGTMTIVTDVETVSSVFAGAGSIDADADTSTYLGCYAVEVPTRFLGRIDEVKLSKTYPPVAAVTSAPLSDEADTWALWHMDSTTTIGLLPYVLDDDSVHEGVRDRNLQISLASLASPGYDGVGRCLQFDPTAIDASQNVILASPALWVYEQDHSASIRPPLPEEYGRTFKYEGWISNDNPLGAGDLCGTYDQVRVRHAAGEAIFHVKTWEEGYDPAADSNGLILEHPYYPGIFIHHGDPNRQVTSTVTADMVDTDAWQHVTAAYELDYDGVGTLTLETDVETVVLADGNAVGAIAPHIAVATERMRIWVYVGNQKYNANFHGRMDEVRISTPPQIACGIWGYYDGDFNKDCYVDKQELGDLGEAWLVSTNPANANWQLGLADQYLNYNIPFATTTPTIDGVLSAGEYADAKLINITYPEVTFLPHMGGHKYEEPTGPDDLSADYYFKWDYTYLYVGIKVYDANVIFWVIYPPDGSPYPYDHAVLCVNIGDDGNNVATDAALYEMHLYRGDENDPRIRLHTDFNQDFNAINAVKEGKILADHWVFEVAFKWSDFDGYSPTVNDKHGLGCFLVDEDLNTPSWPGRDTFLWDFGQGVNEAAVTPSMYNHATLVTSLSCGEHGYLATDSNRDCVTNIVEFAVMAADWMKCTDPNPNVTGCDDLL